MKLSAIALIALTIPALARYPLIGDLGGSCRPDLQCWLNLKPLEGGGYRVSYIAADGLDAANVKCIVRGSVKKAGDSLRGELGSDPVEIVILPQPQGFFVKGVDGGACGIAVNGVYTAIGD